MAGANRSSSSTRDDAESSQDNSATVQSSDDEVSLINLPSNTLQLTTHKLNRKNYLSWAQTVKLLIDGKGKLGFLTGEAKKPGEKDPKLKTWRSENSMVTAWLINSMDYSIGKPFLFLPTAKAARQGDREVMVYCNEMVNLWQELDLRYEEEWDCTNDSVHCMKRELDEVRGRILGRKPLPSIQEVFSEVRREKKRRSVMMKKEEARGVTEAKTFALVSRGADLDGDRRNTKKNDRP
ncbi:uncharacterized protein LOC112092806 [Morus notabilis]|uniref:uncharacterized protein LOC112092806 n=1 Tax=Morus notabilis TaxID=981085 RepID=UPI000CED259A|nr:uncharacterized protein LOC112092806 [Morus notabilis]